MALTTIATIVSMANGIAAITVAALHVADHLRRGNTRRRDPESLIGEAGSSPQAEEAA